MRSRADWAVLALAAWEGGWMAFDGGRALFVGDYVTFGGELGPWAGLLEALGVDPRASAVKALFLVYGLVWLGLAAAFARRASWSRRGMAAAAVGTLWYLVLGTVASAVQLALLAWAGRRRATRAAARRCA
jgi:hypothetical protein